MKKLIFLFLFLPLLTPQAAGQVIVTVAGGGGTFGDGGPATDAVLKPYGIAVDDSGSLYICDDNGGAYIRKVSPAYYGIITTIAGNGGGYSGDGGLGINAGINGTDNIAVDHHGNVYFNDDYRIRKITPADTITTIAGTGVGGYNGDGIPATAAQLNLPRGIAVDNIGNIYIADGFNHRIRRVDTTGIISTIAGTGIAGFSPDGSRADTTRLDSLYGIRIDKSGNIFFADNARIRKIDTAGIITTVAGNGIFGYSGDSLMATEAEIGGGEIAIDESGNLFIADDAANRVIKVFSTGTIYTLAGNGGCLYGGDGGNPLLAGICSPVGVAVNDSGDVYVSDLGNDRVRLITKHPLKVENIGAAGNSRMRIWPNPCSEKVHVKIIGAAGSSNMQFRISSVTGSVAIQGYLLQGDNIISVESLPSGMYMVEVRNPLTGLKVTQKVVKE